jgi:hypothetical protein
VDVGVHVCFDATERAMCRLARGLVVVSVMVTSVFECVFRVNGFALMWCVYRLGFFFRLARLARTTLDKQA